MIKETDITVPPKFIKDYAFVKKQAAKKLHLNVDEITAVVIQKRSVDARKKPVYRLRVNVFINEEPLEKEFDFNFEPVTSRKKVIIVGSGPAGLFAALKLIEHNIKPVIIERGKDVRNRRFDLKAILQEGKVNSNSNYCFGEGGAGTYSDGKLYTRSNKRGNVKRIIDILVYHGADKEISIDSHPHIGSNKLPKIIQAIRETIIKCNGEFHFNSKVTDFIISNRKIKGVIVNGKAEFLADAVIVATGHSARDIYDIYKKHNIAMEAKPFALGVRIEHPQALINTIQYHSNNKHENLPAAAYNLACQVDNKGVYSFCMCPGGMIIPASTGEDELVLNGMSVSKRNSPFANSGLVVEVNANDWGKYKRFGSFAGVMFQRETETTAFNAGGGKQVAPAQRITDFVKGRISATLPETSYVPGIVSVPLHEIFPKEIVKRLRKSLLIFNKKMKGYYTEEAQILAVESRTSSPVRILRNPETLMAIDVQGLYPAGEGAGYAGGIVSAAIDGERCASKI